MGGNHGRIVYERGSDRSGTCSGDSEKEGSYKAEQRTGGCPSGGDTGESKTKVKGLIFRKGSGTGALPFHLKGDM